MFTRIVISSLLFHSLLFSSVSAQTAAVVRSRPATGSERNKQPAASRTTSPAIVQIAAADIAPEAAPTPTPVKISETRGAPERTEVARRENFGDDVQGGNVVVKVTSNGSATAKLGMAQHGATVIEFMASDPVYRIFAGDENFVRVDCGVRDKDDRCQNTPSDTVVLFPGKLFNQWESGDDAAATTITVQRVSGIIVSFIVVPVRSIDNHTFHVAVRYDLDEVIAQRRAAGLPFNLTAAVISNSSPGGASPDNSVPNNNRPVALGENINAVLAAKSVNAAQMQNVSAADNASAPAADYQSQFEEADAELRRVAKSGNRVYFNKPVHGLSLALVSSDARVADYAIDAVVVKNVTQKAIRLVPQQPQILVESANPKDSRATVLSETLPLIYVSTTCEEDDVLLPNQVYYYAFVYKTPILGAKQALRVAFAQREASDEPSTLSLLGLSRLK